jgi:hypothetical protein
MKFDEIISDIISKSPYDDISYQSEDKKYNMRVYDIHDNPMWKFSNEKTTFEMFTEAGITITFDISTLEYNGTGSPECYNPKSLKVIKKSILSIINHIEKEPLNYEHSLEFANGFNNKTDLQTLESSFKESGKLTPFWI